MSGKGESCVGGGGLRKILIFESSTLYFASRFERFVFSILKF